MEFIRGNPFRDTTQELLRQGDGWSNQQGSLNPIPTWCLAGNEKADMSYSLNSLKGGYIGDFLGDYYRGY